MRAYRRDKNLRGFLEHSTSGSQRPFDAGSFPCRSPRRQTCQYMTSQTILYGPKSSHTMHNCFTCQSENVVYCITCRRCTSMYIGETGSRLREHFGEHLRSIRNRSPELPVAEHLNSANHTHTIDDIMICGVKQCSDSNTSRKQQEMQLIFNSARHVQTERTQFSKLTSVFYASVLLLMINFVITLTKLY